MKFLRYIQKKRRAMLALAALTIFSSPFTAHASNITTKAGETLKPTNNIYNIPVQKKLSNQVGVNKFTDFNLDKGQIANIQFNKLQTVANLVDNKISINGTVNALRDGKIGGNLYFLSPNGIAVGSSGVINAGAFTGMAVSQSYFNKLSKIESGSEFMTQLAPKNIEYNNDPDKGVDIQGVINAPGGISLYATKIDVGKNAILRTDVEKVDFTKVVNIEGVDSGITEGFDVSYKDGDIVLKAHAEHVADDNLITNISGDTASQWEKVTDREATINVDGKIISAGNVSINADAVTTFSEGSYFNIISQTGFADALLGNLGLDVAVDFAKKTNKANVNIGKTADIYSKSNMDIGATGTLNVTINATTPAVKSGTTKVTDGLAATSVAVISASNEATVNIDGKLKSDGTMAINAKATTSLSSTANTSTLVGKEAGEKGVKEDTNYIAISVIDGDTKAEVNINSENEIIVGGNDSKDTKAFSATAKTENTITNSATAATAATSIGSTTLTENDDIATTTAVNFTDYSATANVNVNSKINAKKGGINLDATNTFKNSLTASTVTGRAVKPMENWAEVAGPDFLNSISNNLAGKLTSYFQKAASNIPKEGGGSTFSKLFNGEYLKTGISVGVFLQDNNAKVNVGKKITLNAQNDIDISAKNDITSQNFNLTSTVNNQTSKQKTNAMIGLGVLVSDITNNADIVNDGNLNSTSGNVNLETTSGMNYNQFDAVINNITKAFTDIAKDATELFSKDTQNTFAKYQDQVKAETDKLEKTDDPAEYMQALDNLNKKINDTQSTGFSAFVKGLNDGVKVKKDLENLPSKLTSFLHPSSFANYYARSSFGAGADGNKDVKLEAAGSFSINSMLNNSRIISGENSVITAENGAVNTNSLAQNRVVAITGMGGEHLTSSEAQNSGAGISVFVGNFKNNAVTAFGKNSQIKSKDIKLETKDYAKHVNIIYGNGKADSTSITGMVSYIKSPANSVLALDDSTKLNGSGKVELNALSENYITSVNGAITMGNGNGKSFGAAINVLSNDGTTSVMVADNGVNSSLSDNITNLQKDIENATDQNIIIDKKTELKTLKITKAAQDALGDDYTKKLGDSSKDTGEISADTFTTNAKNSGTINAIAVEGTENSESHGLADKFNGIVGKGETQLSYVETAFKWPANKLSKMLGNTINDKFKSGQPNANDAANQAGEAAGNEDGGAGANAGVDSQAIQNQLNVAGAGSAAINIKSGETGSLISNSNINAKNIDVSANDDSFNGSWAGAGAFNFFGNSQAAKNTNVAIGGAVAYSDNSKNVDSIIKNSTINATSIKNSATRDDSDVAAGLGLAVSTNSGNQGTNTDVAISASINFVEGDTHALLLNNTVNGGSLENKAALGSLQVAGGLDIAVSVSGEKGFSIGGSAAASKITNDLQSGIRGGSYENLSKVDITATKKANQVDVAIAGGVTAGSNTSGFSFGGAVAVSDINNNSRAFLNDTKTFQSTGIVNLDALDTKNENSRVDYLSSRKININPVAFLNDLDKNKINGTGANIVNVALGGGGSTSEAGAGGLGISYAGISNLMNVDINNNQAISAQNFNANTTNDSNIVNVTLGLAGSNKSFSAAGSFGVSDIVNDGTINIKNSNVTATNDFLSSAQSNAHIVNVAGQAALASSFAGGLTFAYNAMNNTTGINVSGGMWNVKNFGANSANNNYALSLGAGVGFSKENAALNGAVALNLGNNSTKSIIDGSTITDVNTLNVTATDNTSKTTVAGDINITKGGAVALGGAVAYANIGTTDNKEVINAKITNATINKTIEIDNPTINVEALDKATMNTVAVGVGGSVGDWTFVTFQGAAAVSFLNKDIIAQISNSTISNGADIAINASSGGTSSKGLTIDDEHIDVNNKVNTAAAVLDGNLGGESIFDGAFAISVNNFNQSTQANFKNDSQPTTISNAGNVDISSSSEADILGVAIGGSGGKSKVSASGSVSYNYIDNSAKSLAENLNLDADKNFGVVAQSDDKIANYAGAVNVDVNGYGSIGVSVAYNEIKGNTDALVNNSKLDVTGSTNNAIKYSNPNANLINNYVTKDNWISGRLLDGRTQDESKSGVVVNSSATHSISSDLATIGIRASTDSPGVGISGTVNINKINGATNAKVENTGVDGKADTFINSSDYTNNGSFVGNAAVSGTVAIGVLWNENQVNRETNSLVNGGTLNVKNLDVKADSQQGLSNLNIAVGASFAADSSQGFAAASGDNVVRNQMEGMTTAKIENATVNHSGNVNVNAYHKDNAFATNLAVGAAIDLSGGAGATFDMGYGLIRENSTAEAEINNSTLTSKEKGAVNVNAENNSKIAGAFGTLGVAAKVGDAGGAVSIALGINNNYITNNVHAGIKGSKLDVGAVDVNAKNTSEIKADGGVAAVAINISETFFASMGAAVAVTNATFDNKVTADVDKSTINAAGDVNINARDDHKSDETVVSAAASTGLAVSVNRMSTSINSGLANLKESQLGKTLSAEDLVMNTDNASEDNASSDSDKLNGEFGSETRFINEDAVDDLLGGVHANSASTKQNISETIKKRYAATVNYNNSLGNGVFANVTNGSNIDAGTNNISIASTENNDLAITSGSGNAGIVGIGVGSTTIQTRRANTSNVIGSTLNAKNINISTTNGQTGSSGIYSKMYNATITAVGASVGYNNIETNGTGEILISGSTLTAADNLNAAAIDNSKSKSYILDAGLKIYGYTGVFAYNTNTSQTGIEVSNTSTLNANAINFDTQNHTYRATDTLAISANAWGLQTSTSEAKDLSTNFINVKGAGNSFTADDLTFNALNSSQTYAHTNGQGYGELEVVVANGLANANTNANISIDDANTFANKTINITSQIGQDDKYTTQVDGFGISVSGVGISVDNMTAQTNSKAQVNIGNEIYNDTTTLNVNALNKASRDSFMRNNSYAVVANISDISAYTIAKDTASISVGSSAAVENANKLAAININADTSNNSFVAAKGTGGAIGGEFGSAAHADNDANNTSSATLNGNWNIAGDLTLSANQHDGAYISGYSARGAILTGGKGSLDNVIKGSSTATISEGANINAKTINVNSKNYITTDKYSSDYDYTLFGRMGGVIDDVDYQRSTATTAKSANINIGKNATITTTGTQTYDAASDYNLKNEVYAEGGSALVSLRWSKSHNYITANENISVGKNATLKNEGGSQGGITLAAHDNLELNPSAIGNSQAGTGGYVRAETLISLTRTPTITIEGTVKSAKDLNLYAGADINGDRARVHSFAQAVSQVHTLISDGSADIIRTGVTNANVNVKGGAYGQATHDINIISNAGNEIYEERAYYGSTWSSDGENKVVTSDIGGVTTGSYLHNNIVEVDGELKAGSNPEATINISGVAVPDGFILANKNAKNLSYSVTSGDYTITKKNTDLAGMSSEQALAQRIFNGITTNTAKPEESLVPRYKEICESISNYQVQGKKDIVAYNGYLQEKSELESEMVKLGMGSYNAGGEFMLGSNTKTIGIKTVELPEIEVSGGNINVNTGSFIGSGVVDASGVPKIDAENNSTAYLVTNRLTVIDKGGAINYNGTEVANNSDINKLNSLNGGASFIVEVAPKEAVPLIKVTNSYAGSGAIPIKPDPSAKDYNNLPADAKKATLQYTPINYIEVAGNVTNPVGKAQIINKQGSIRINKGANVNALDIEMTAKDSISQGYTNSIVNIGYTPEDAYADEAKKLREKIGWDKNMPMAEDNKTEKSDYIYNGGSAWQAGNTIYISARDININGLLQAGYASFEGLIAQGDIDNAAEQVFFNGKMMYKVNEGGGKFDKSKGYYIYEPQIYYDKENNQLYVEDINATGGKIYLAGRVSSTGNGKIVVSDGSSNIDITNDSSVDMKIGNVNSTQGGGFIQISDSAQDKLSEYSSGQTRTINNYSDWILDNTKGKVATNSGLTMGKFVNYNPKAGLAYNWTEGTTQEKKTHYFYMEEQSWWGLADDPDYSSDLSELSQTVKKIINADDEDHSDKASTWEETKAEIVDLGEGYYIGNGDVTSDNLTLRAQNVKTEDSYGNHTRGDVRKHTLNFYHDYDHRWTQTTGTKQIYQYSVKADYPISVGIIGQSNPHINIKNTSANGGDLYLAGEIKKDNGTLNISAQGGNLYIASNIENGSGALTIATQGGKIEQEEGVTVATDNINLTARTGIKNIDIINHRTDDLKLNAQTTAGDIDINVQGGLSGDKYTAGNLLIANAINNRYNAVTLTAQGDIKQSISGTAITAHNIKLDSLNGSINLQIESPSIIPNSSFLTPNCISAAANGDIKLVKNDNDDFRIGSIVSTNGDVTLTAKGKFIDALDKVRDNADTDESNLVKSWIDMGLIAGTDDYKGAYLNRLEQDRDAYKSDVTAQFKEYEDLLLVYQKQLAEYNAIEDKTILAMHQGVEDASKVTPPTMSNRLELLSKKFSNYKSADEYLATDKNYQTLVETVKNPQYKWTQDELLSGIRSAIVNKQEGTAYDVTHLKDANITGRNVTLTGAGVGTNSKDVTTIKMSELRVKANETDKEKSARLAKLSQLANVEAADVNVNYVLDKNGKPITQTVTQINYNYDADKGYYIDTAGNYIRYRKDADGNLLKYTYDKDLKQVGKAVAVSDFSDVIKSTTTIENKAIDSFDISGKIPLGINATGNITVTATGNNGVYIAGRNKGVKITETTNPNNDIYSPLNIINVETTKTGGKYADVRIIGEAGIFNAANTGANVIGNDLVLVGGNGAIGTQEKPFVMTLTGDLLNARSNEEINLQKVGTGNFRISAIYSPKAIRIANDQNGIIEHSTRFDDIAAAYINSPAEITLTGSAGTADNPILIRPTTTTTLNLIPNSSFLIPNFYINGLNPGTITLNDLSGNVDISANGSIGQTKNAANNLTSLKVSAKGGVILDGNNKLSAINLGAIGGDFTLKNDSDKLTANFGSTIKGNATINQTGDINLAGSVNGNILNLTSEKGNITSTGGLSATKEINLSVKAFSDKGEIHTDKLTIATDNGVTINNTENTFNALEISSRSGNAINGSIDVTIKADKFAPSIKNDITGDVTLTNTKTGGLLSFGSGETINIGGNFTATTNGDFDYGATILAGKDINIFAQNVYRREGTTGYFSSPSKILFNVDKNNKIGTVENPVMIGNSANKTAGINIYGETHIKGVNDGILTLGNVMPDNGVNVSISSEGSIAQADDKIISLSSLTLEAAKDITLDKADNDIETITLLGGNNIKVNSVSLKGLTVAGNLKAKGDVDITSEQSLNVTGDIESEKNLTLTAGTNLTSSNSSVLKSGNNITLKADDVKLSGKVETPYKEPTLDNEDDEEKFFKEMPVISVTTNKGLDMQNVANSFESVEVKSTGNSINGSVLVTSNSEGYFAKIDTGKITGDLSLVNTDDDGAIDLKGYEYGTLNVKGNATLDMGGVFMVDRQIWSNKNINITSRNNALFILNLDSTQNDETLKATKDINLNAAKTIGIDGQITAGGSVIAKSAGINIVDDANVNAGNDITLTVGEGNINISGSAMTNKGNVMMSINKGNLTIEGKLRANNGAVDVELKEGNIQIGNEKTKQNNETVVNAKRDITITTGNGIVNVFGKTKSTSGSINVTHAKTNDTSANVAEFYSYDGTPILFATNIAENADVKTAGDITVNAELEADHSVSITTDGGDIEITKRIAVTNGNIMIETANGNIIIDDDGIKNMVSAQNNLNIQADNGAVIVSGKVATQNGDIIITSNHNSYTAGQKGITVDETGSINPAGNVNLNVQNGDIEFKRIAAQNATINSNTGNVTADTIRAADTVRIALSGGDLYLNLAQSKGVAILTGDNSNSTVNTIRADSVDVNDAVTVGKILPYRSNSVITPTTGGGSTGSGSSTSYSGSYSGGYNAYSNAYSSGYSNFASNPSSFATLGTTYTNDGLTYWQNVTSPAAPSYKFSEFTTLTDDISHMQTRNYFEVKFIPTWLEKEFMSIDFDYSFDDFGIRNATEDELTID